MNRKIGAAVAAAVLAAAGGGWVLAEQQARTIMDSGVAAFRAQIGPDARFTYASAAPSLLRRDATFTGAVLSTPDATVTADTLTVRCSGPATCSGTADGVKATGPKGEADGTASAEHVGWTNLTLPPTPPSGSRSERTARYLLGAAFDAAEARGVRLATPKGETTVGSLAASDYGAGRRTRAAMDAAAIKVPAGKEVDRVQVAHAGFDGVDVVSVAEAIRAGRRPPTAQGRQSFELAGVDLSKGGAPLLHLTRASGTSDAPAAGPAQGTLDVAQLQLSNLPPEAAGGLRALGYDRFDGDLHADAAFDQAAGDLAIREIRLTARQMGQLAIAGAFGRVPAATSAAPSPAALLGVTLRNLDLTYADDGLFDRGLAAAGRAQGIGADQVRAGLLQRIAALTLSGAGVPVRDALAAFVRQPGTLTLATHPPQPVSFAEAAGIALGGPDALVSRLGVTAAAK